MKTSLNSHLGKRESLQLQMGLKFMAMLPGVSVVVEFYSHFSGRKGAIWIYWRLYKHSAVPIRHTHNDLSLSHFLNVGLMIFKWQNFLNRKKCFVDPQKQCLPQAELDFSHIDEMRNGAFHHIGHLRSKTEYVIIRCKSPYKLFRFSSFPNLGWGSKRFI